MNSKLLNKANKNSQIINEITVEKAGWEYVNFQACRLIKDESYHFNSLDHEVCIVLIEGLADIQVNEQKFINIGKRLSVFEKIPPYSLYVIPNQEIIITAVSNYLEIGICSVISESDNYETRLILPNKKMVEHRGFGQNKRLVHNILPDSEPADKLLVVEVFTDEGCSSSYPSHKHDDKNSEHETYLEETYYHRINPPQGFSLQRVYTSDGSLDESMAVYDRDMVMVPKGYHPLVTIAGYDNYYLNVMAGPVRLWKFSWENDHQFVNSDDYKKKHQKY